MPHSTVGGATGVVGVEIGGRHIVAGLAHSTPIFYFKICSFIQSSTVTQYGDPVRRVTQYAVR